MAKWVVPTGEAQRWTHKRWKYGWRSIKMDKNGRMCGWRSENMDICQMGIWRSKPMGKKGWMAHVQVVQRWKNEPKSTKMEKWMHIPVENYKDGHVKDGNTGGEVQR